MDRIKGVVNLVRAFVDDRRDSIIVALLVLSILGGVLNFASIKGVQDKQGKEQRVTAAQAYTTCIRSKVFGPALLNHLQAVEDKFHTGTLEAEVEWPLGSHTTVKVLDFYRTTIPKECHK